MNKLMYLAFTECQELLGIFEFNHNRPFNHNRLRQLFSGIVRKDLFSILTDLKSLNK